jgi:hypothetical protein
MADDFTPSLLLTQPEVNANQNIWGPKLNGSFGSQLLEEALVGAASYTLTGPKTLKRTNGETDEARKRVQHITGGTGGTVTIPAVAIWYWFINRSTGNVTVTNGSNSVTVPAGSSTGVFSPDGVTLIVGLTKGYVDSLAFAAALPSQTGNVNKVITTDGTNAAWSFVNLAANVTGTLAVANGGTGLTNLAALKTAVAGWTQIGDPINAVGVSAVTFANVPDAYSEVFVRMVNVSGTTIANISFALSDDGTSYSTAAPMVTSAAAGANYSGGLQVIGGKLGTGVAVASLGVVASREVTTGGSVYAFRCGTALNHVRVLLSTGTFDNGTLTLFGR